MKNFVSRSANFFLVVLLILTFFYKSDKQKCLSTFDLTSLDDIIIKLKKQEVKNRDLETSVNEFLKRHEDLKDENNLLREKLFQQTSKMKQIEQEINEREINARQVMNNKQPEDTSTKPTLEEEILKRKIKNNAIELLYSIKAEILSLPESNTTKQKEKKLKQLKSQHNALMIDIQKLIDSNNLWKKQEMEDLQDLVQSRIYHVQNPSSCEKAKKLICNIHKQCGFGCQIHHVAYCLLAAFASNRTMILLSQGWAGEKEGWASVFKPVSDTCTERNMRAFPSLWTINNDQLEVIFPPVELFALSPPYFAPFSIPKDLSERIKRLHGHPGVWWISQFVKYLFRGQSWFENALKVYEKQVGYDQPIVGIHVRRTDKVGDEASFHSVHEYMEHVAAWYDLYEMKHNNQEKMKRRVYLATDDPKVLDEAKTNFGDYVFVSFSAFSQSAVIPEKREKSLESLTGVISDIYLLSMCDYVVCTFSSQVCRTAYELMQTRRPDASFDAHSLDDIYYYGGQKPHKQAVIYGHEPEPGSEEIELRVRDVIVTAGNHWNGYSKGRNIRTEKTGFYPSWKVEDIIEDVVFPTYPRANKKKTQ